MQPKELSLIAKALPFQELKIGDLVYINPDGIHGCQGYCEGNELDVGEVVNIWKHSHMNIEVKWSEWNRRAELPYNYTKTRRDVIPVSQASMVNGFTG